VRPGGAGDGDRDREPETSELPAMRAEETQALDVPPRAGDETEAAYRSSGTVALSPVRRRTAERTEPRPAEEERERRGGQAARPRRRRRRLRAGRVIAVLAVAGILAALWSATRAIYFLGTDPQHANAVTIYRGLPYDGPLGVRLYSPVVRSGATLAQVPADRRRVFTDHQLRSLNDAQDLLLQLERGRLQ
jgi:protein phosphatase